MSPAWSVSMADTPIESARYALTRRLLPVLRHHMVVHLQPIGMIYEVLDRKLGAGAPDLAAIREGLGKINNLARSAVNSCLDVVTWLAPDATATIGLSAGVADCLEMLSGNFRFRGFTICNEIGDAPLQVSQAALREVFTSALIALTDGADGPVDLVLGVRLSGGETAVTVQTRPGQGSGFTTEMAYRAMAWSDVLALAQAHGVALTREGPLATLKFAAASANTDTGAAAA